MKLPKGWKVIKDSLVGFTFFRGKDIMSADLRVQHPVDDDSIRKYIRNLDAKNKK